MKRLLFILLFLASLAVSAQGAERILSYDSLIKVHPAGDMTVTETITVVCEGRRIKHGIYRDFPTRYKDGQNNTVTVDFKVQSALKDGKPVHWWTENKDNGVRVYMGNKHAILKPGRYSYTLTYHTNRQLGFFKTHDELYWNVTGNGWAFPIDKAKATVELPAGTRILSTEAYTGAYGKKGTDYSTSYENGIAYFSTTRPLRPKEGLTIVVTWPKGIVHEPTSTEKAKAFFSDNRSTAAGAVGIVILLIYYYLTWLKVGKDPDKGVIIPLYEAPKGFSPASVRYVMRMGFDHKAFAAAIVNIAIKGLITIEQDVNRKYTLTKTSGDSRVLSKGESQIVRQLFSGRNTLAITTSNHKTIKKAITSLQKSLAVDYEKIYFLSNKGALVPGLVVSIITIVAIVLLSRNLPVAAFMSVWLSGWTVGCAALVYSAFKAWRPVITGQSSNVLPSSASASFLTLFSLPFLAGECFGIWIFTTATSIPAVLSLFTIVILNIVFYHLMKAPTIKGRKIMDQIEGLKLYLSVAEKDRLNDLYKAENPIEVFEKFLPYALALDVEQEWCEKFSQVLAQAAQESGYTPTWYAGSHIAAMGVAGLASSLGNMSSSISSSSSPPGSSSGSGGGGSSGGGGGGGGGGGW